MRERNNERKTSALQRYLPIMAWLPHYRRSWLRPDLFAGLTLWAVLVPEAMAYAGIAGVDPVIGLYTVPLPLLAYAVFGSSRIMVVGPDSATALLSAATIGSLAASGSADYVALTAALAILVGILFLVFGLLRLGWVTDFISRPVMQGFIAGVVLVTIIGQVPTLIGLTPTRGDFFQQLWDILGALYNVNLATVTVGVGCLLLLFWIRKHAPRVPAALATIVVAIMAVTLLDLQGRGVAVVGTIAAGLPRLSLPSVGGLHVYKTLFSGALAIVLLGYAETLGSAKAAAAETGETIDPNQELLALGPANLGAGLSGGFVAVGSFSKTSVVLAAKAKTQLGFVLTAGLVVLTLLYLMPVFEHLPDAALAAVVIEAMVALADPAYFRKLWRISHSEFLLAFVAMFGVLSLGVLPGIGAGIALDLLLLIRSASRPRAVTLGKTAGHVFQDLSLHPEGTTVPGLVVFRFEAPLIFTNASFFVEEVERLASEGDIDTVLVDAEGINGLDSTAAERLLELHDELKRRQISLCFARVRDPVKDVMRASGVLDAIGEDHIYGSITAGVKAFKRAHKQPG
ncbi:MAG: SulP family inorganic anion transporter [Actinobacteria bacterium]|nr:SulP family inorganic anion transporter [Actinomycetota bacterium]